LEKDRVGDKDSLAGVDAILTLPFLILPFLTLRWIYNEMLLAVDIFSSHR